MNNRWPPLGFRFCPVETSEYSSSDGRACSLVLFALETVVMDGPSLLYRFYIALLLLLHFSPFISGSIDSDEHIHPDKKNLPADHLRRRGRHLLHRFATSTVFGVRANLKKNAIASSD